MKIIGLFLIGLFALMLINGTNATSKYEFYDCTACGAGSLVYSSDVNDNYAMNFTIGGVGTNEQFTLEQIKLKLWRTGSPGSGTLRVYTTSGGYPTGSALSTASINGNVVTTDSNGAWYTYTMSGSVILQPSTVYSIEVDMASTNVSNQFRWTRNNENLFSSGIVVFTPNNGSSWVEYSSGNADAAFEVWGTKVNSIPTLSSIVASPDPIKGGNTITFTPTGQEDGDSDDLYYYCDTTTTPTSANTDCSEGNASYSSPYSGMTCTFTSETDDTEHTRYCRVYDSAGYSTPERNDSYTTDSTAPSTSITSVAGDSSTPYLDETDDSATTAIIAGEASMVCRWDTTDIVYASMGNECSIDGSNATCAFGDLGNGSYTRYVSCNDSLGNAQTTGTNLNIDFDVSIDDAPVLTSISVAPSPLKGGNTITVTPSGVSDAESGDLNFFCAHSTTPTSGSNICTEADANYSTPYSGMTCTASSLINDIENTIYCRVFDATSYSNEQTDTYVSDSTPPSLTTTSVAGDSSAPFVDVVNDELTAIVASGEVDMVCRWASTDIVYSSMVNDCLIDSNNTTCNVIGLGQGNYERYVSCVDSLGNANAVDDNLNINFTIDWNDQPIISDVNSTGGIITQGEDVDFSIAWSDEDDEDVKAHVCKTDAITVQVCNGGAWVEESSFDSVTPIETSYSTSISDFGTLNYYVFVCDVNDLCSVSSSGSFTMNVMYDPTYVDNDIPPIMFDFLGGVLAAFVLMVPIIGLSMIVIWIRA